MLHIEEDTKLLLDIMTDILKISEKELLYSKVPRISFARTLIMEQLFTIGYNKNTIGRALHKNHSAIIQGLRRLDSIKGIPGYNDVWDLKKKLLDALKKHSIELQGVTPSKCIWSVPPEKRLCLYCKVQNCDDRKHTHFL